ncbi:MAG: glucose dehydrogenase [Chloroflexi bacterium]|nr:glucose dehydrogenase [Chloroflexota bacterium]
MNQPPSREHSYPPPPAHRRTAARRPNPPPPAKQGEVSRSDGGGLPALLAIIVSAIMLLAACGDDQPRQPGNPEPEQPAMQAQVEPQDQPEQPAVESRVAANRERQDQPAQEQTTAAAEQQQAHKQPSAPLEPTLQPILGGYQFEQPTELLALADGSFLIAEQRGSITRFVEDGDEVKQFGVLDLTESVVFAGERGLLSMALNPAFPEAPFLYVYYSPRGTNVSRLSRFELRDGAAQIDSELIVIEVDQPFPNHNGGAVRFGPDGMLYLGLGDGGAANDPQGHGQNRQTLLGTIIRIDVNDIDATTPYRIPTDNPFLGIAGVRPEIWAYGLRNPWRMAFDPETDMLWVGDVGQNRVEEIAIVRAGENHGWNVFEGDECFGSEDACATLSAAVAPVATYGHDEGCSVTGGMVYGGEALPHLQGVYIFGDYCSGTIWGLRPNDSTETGWTRDVILESDSRIASFATDDDGEIYVLVFSGPILKLVAGER